MKNLKKFLFSLTVAFLSIINVEAATGSIRATTSAGTIAVGSTFTVSVNVSCSEALGSWQFGISYDSSVISLQSGDTYVASYGDGSTKSKNYTYKFKAIKPGTGGVRISSPSMVSWNDDNTLFTPSTKDVSVTVKTRSEIEASYSKDNNLKSLTVEGFELTPAFSKDITSYTVSVPDTTTSIKVNAQVNDSTARISGTGEKSISEGSNKIEVVVTAQNGSLKTYTIMVDVKDLNPIETTLDGKKYTVVKKEELLKEPIGYTKLTIKIDGIDIPAFKSELTKLTIVGLKNEEGDITMFSYDEDKKKFSKYEEIKGASLTLLPIKTENDINGFERIKYKINDVETEAFKSLNDDSFIIIYAMNVETGKEDYYILDSDTNSFVKYNPDIFKSLSDEVRDYKLIAITLGGISIILILLVISFARKNTKIKKMAKKLAVQKKFEEKQKNRTVDENLDTQQIVEEDHVPQKKRKKKTEK